MSLDVPIALHSVFGCISVKIQGKGAPGWPSR